MSYASTDNFEAIAQDAVNTLTTVGLTLLISGDEDDQGLAVAILESTEKLIYRAIALGAE